MPELDVPPNGRAADGQEVHHVADSEDAGRRGGVLQRSVQHREGGIDACVVNPAVSLQHGPEGCLGLVRHLVLLSMPHILNDVSIPWKCPVPKRAGRAAPTGGQTGRETRLGSVAPRLRTVILPVGFTRKIGRSNTGGYCTESAEIKNPVPRTRTGPNPCKYPNPRGNTRNFLMNKRFFDAPPRHCLLTSGIIQSILTRNISLLL